MAQEQAQYGQMAAQMNYQERMEAEMEGKENGSQASGGSALNTLNKGMSTAVNISRMGKVLGVGGLGVAGLYGTSQLAGGSAESTSEVTGYDSASCFASGLKESSSKGARSVFEHVSVPSNPLGTSGLFEMQGQDMSDTQKDLMRQLATQADHPSAVMPMAGGKELGDIVGTETDMTQGKAVLDFSAGENQAMAMPAVLQGMSQATTQQAPYVEREEITIDDYSQYGDTADFQYV